MTDWFAGDVAERYDESTAGKPVEPVVDFLEPLADGGALELAIGTGRIAVPLAARGVRVAGIDLSPDMVAQLRKKTDEIPVEIGDMSTTKVDGHVLARLRRLQLDLQPPNAGATGRVLRERRGASRAGRRHSSSRSWFPSCSGCRSRQVPSLRRNYRSRGRSTSTTSSRRGSSSHHYTPFDGECATFPCRRSIWPSELDLMARLAGMELRERWADWDRSPFTAESTKHVSVWEKSTG